MSNDLDDFLSHYGIPGMKWGVRRRSSRISSRSSDAAKAIRYKGQAKKRGVSSLSNDQLSKLNKRLELEKKYKDLNPRTVEKGHKEVRNILALVATAGTVAALASRSPVVRTGINVVKEMLATAGSAPVGILASQVVKVIP